MPPVLARNLLCGSGYGQAPRMSPKAAVLLLVLSAGCAREAAPSRAPQATWAAPTPAPAASGAPDAQGVTAQTGEATYYSDRLAGRPTASGEPYDPRALSAAHRTLPFGTEVRVTRTDSGQSVLVRINDRGPFGKARRIIDLSRAAAERIDMIRAGVVPVSIEVVSSARGVP